MYYDTKYYTEFASIIHRKKLFFPATVGLYNHTHQTKHIFITYTSTHVI